MLPLIVFAVGIVFYNYKQDRSDATRRVLENVRSMRLVLDSEVQRMTGGLQVLALTNSLRNDDFQNFRRIALGFLDQYGKGGLVLISDRKAGCCFPPQRKTPQACRHAAISRSSKRSLRPGRRNIPTCSPARSTGGRCSPSRFRCSATAR